MRRRRRADSPHKGKLRSFLWCHSLSLAMATGFLLFALAAIPFAPDVSSYFYDLFLSLAAGCAGAGLLLVLSRPLYEEEADPTAPPVSRETSPD